MKKTKFTIEQHEKLGKELKIIRDRIQQISVEISHAYPIATGLTNLTNKAQQYIDDLRNKMDSAVFNELGKKSNHDTCKIYYRGRNYSIPEYGTSSLMVKLDK